MEHPFLSRRTEFNAVQDGIALFADIVSILSISESDKVCIIRREDDEIKDENVRNSVCRHSSRLGLLLKDADKIVQKDLDKLYGSMWCSFIRGGKDVPPSLIRTLEQAASELRAKRDAMQETEMDDGSSSYSDYSASRTESSEDESEDEESPSDRLPKQATRTTSRSRV